MSRLKSVVLLEFSMYQPFMQYPIKRFDITVLEAYKRKRYKW